MKHVFLTLSLVSVLISVAKAQTDEIDHAAINDSRIKLPVVKVAISHIINFSEALLPLAVEYRFNRIVGAEVEIGIPLFFNTLTYKSSSGPMKDLNSDMKLRADVRFYFVSEADNAGYIGLDGSFRKQQYTLTNAEYYDASGYQNSFVSADINKIVYTVNVIVGMQANISRRLFAEMQTGLGFKGVEVQRSNIEYIGKGQYPHKFRWEIPIGEGEDKIAGQSGFINIPFAVRLCYRL